MADARTDDGAWRCAAGSIRNNDEFDAKSGYCSGGAPKPARHESSRCSGEREAAPRAAGRRDDVAVTVEKALELIGTGDSVQDAVTEALDRARMTLEGITGFEVVRISGTVDDATTEYRVELRVWFVLRDRMHG